MTDTIEWLETIGKNAKLRYAEAEDLADSLAQANASNALKAAVISGDRSHLSGELGHGPMRVDHGSNSPGHEEDEDQGDNQQTPPQPPKPDQSRPLHDQ